MFKKIMAKLGVGSAEVDLVLNKDEYVLGETIEGEFKIVGGTVEQEINKIDVDLVFKLQVKGREFSKVVTSIPIVSSFVISPNEEKSFPFSYELPNNLPISSKPISYGFATRLDIAAGVDHLDHDFIKVMPPERFHNIIKAFDALGFREKADSGKFNGFTQEFEFVPTTQLHDQVNEVEFIAGIEEDGIRLLLEVDMATLPFGLAERELKKEFYIENSKLTDIRSLSNLLKENIKEMVKNPGKYPGSTYPKKHGFGQAHHGKHFSGAMGGFAAGLFGGMLLEEMLGDSVEDMAFGGEGDDGGGLDMDFGDFFGGDGGDF